MRISADLKKRGFKFVGPTTKETGDGSLSPRTLVV